MGISESQDAPLTLAGTLDKDRAACAGIEEENAGTRCRFHAKRRERAPAMLARRSRVRISSCRNVPCKSASIPRLRVSVSRFDGAHHA